MTNLDFDSSGRLEAERPEPGGGARTTYLYTPASSASSPARVLIRQHTNDSR